MWEGYDVLKGDGTTEIHTEHVFSFFGGGDRSILGR